MVADDAKQLAALDSKIDDVEAEIAAVKAALELAAYEKPKQDDEATQTLLAAAGPIYGGNWSRDELKERLTALTAELTELIKEKNLLLQGKRSTYWFLCFSCLTDNNLQ